MEGITVKKSDVEMTRTTHASHLLLALTSLYLVWGSTYLAIAIAVQSLPPLLMAALRFLVAGSLMLLVLRVLGTSLPTRRQWLGATAVGTLLLLGGNGTVCLVAHVVPSSVVALVIACTTLAMVLVGWAAGGPRPTLRLSISIVIGLVGVAVLVWDPHASWPTWAVLALLFAALSWAAGSVLSKRLGMAWQIPSPWMATAAHMLAGGAVMLIAVTVRGEWAAASLAIVTQASALAWAYLVVAGSIVGFGSYVWLLRNASPALATSYGYVNPLVAIVLGAWLHQEPITAQTLTAGGVILLSVALIATAPRHAGG